MSLRVAIACGGTGGHLFPGMAVAEALRARGHQTLLILSNKKIDATVREANPEFEYATLPTMGWPGASLRLPVFGLRLIQAIGVARAMFRRWKPDAVLGMGGFVSAVPLLPLVRGTAPGLIHESNAFPGSVTRWLARGLDRVLLGFEACRAHLPSDAKVAVTGTPVRRGLLGVSRDAAARQLNLDPARKTVLVIGGSQGARGINDAVVATLPRWAERREAWQFIHLTGPEDEARVASAYEAAGMPSVVRAFCNEMGPIYALADAAVARSGASSLTELALFRVPSVLVPFPFAADNHQVLNGRVFAEAGAGTLIEQRDLTPERLASELEHLVEAGPRRSAMQQACERFDVENAANRVADAVEEEAKR